MRLVYSWLRELSPVTADVATVARELSLRGFEVASIEREPEAVIDFEITANRPDCLSHVGLAREACAVWGLPLSAQPMLPAHGNGSGLFDVRLEDPDLCPRYCAQAFDVRVGPSPSWLQERLRAAGVRPISNIVDVTNYVMLERGQPMHAFDLARLAERALVIRRARPDETLQTLDGVERRLDAGMLVIADGARATAVGGVMGGRESEVNDGTTRIVLESAYFHAPSVRRTSKRLALRTEASIRFERGGDIDAPPDGLARAAALFEQIGAGRAISGVVDRYPEPREARRVDLRAARLTRILGLQVPDTDVARILTPLGFQVSAHGRGAWTAIVPTFRVDVTREIDLIEEVGRHYGFDRLPATFPALTEPQPAPDSRILRDRRARQILRACGFSEAMTFAFIERQAALPFCQDGFEPAAIANPLSEKFAVLRPSLLPGLVDACVHNRRRERKDVRLFETGARFGLDGERRSAAFVWAGAAAPQHWSAQPRPVDFFDAKGIVEQLCAAFGIEIEVVTADRPWLTGGRSAEVRTREGALLGLVGQIAAGILEARGMPPGEAIVGAELDLGALGEHAGGDDLQAQPLPRYPSIVRDVSILVDEALPAAAVRGTIRSAAPDTLASIAEFDRYQGKGVPDGRVSLSIRLTFRAPDRTLTDEDAQAATERIVEALRVAHDAERR